MRSSRTLKELSNELDKLNCEMLESLQKIQNKYNVEISEIALLHSEEMGRSIRLLGNVTIWVSMS